MTSLWHITWTNVDQVLQHQMYIETTIVRLDHHHGHLSNMYPTMTPTNGNFFHVTGPLWGEFTGHRWISFTKASDTELSRALIFSLICLHKWLSKQSRHQWFEMPWCSLWCYCNVVILTCYFCAWITCSKQPGVFQFSSFHYFLNFSALSNHPLATEHHVHIWQVSPQLSCGYTSQIWMWFKESVSFTRLKILLTEKLTNGTLVTPTPDHLSYCTVSPPLRYRYELIITRSTQVFRLTYNGKENISSFSTIQTCLSRNNA